MSVRRKIIGIAGCMAVLTGVGFVVTTSAYAADSASPTADQASQYTLTSDYHKYDALNDGLVARLGTTSVSTVMNDAKQRREAVRDRFDLWWDLSGYVDGFSFEDADNDDPDSFPQGISSSRDAVGTANGGNYDGHQVVLTSWYTDSVDGAGTDGSFITLVDWDADYPNTYQKILLVEPVETADGPSFTDVGIHAGGASWYGDYLYVAETGKGMRVFDMRKILKTDTTGSATQIGLDCACNTYYAHKYAYVLPQVGMIKSATTSGTSLIWSSISLDRVTNSMVMAEYTCNGCKQYASRPARAVRFPFASGSTAFAASTTASQALKLPWYKINGVASHNGRWWFNSSGDKSLYYWTPSTKAVTSSWVSSGESISYWEDDTEPDMLWSLQEGVGRRNVFAVKQNSYS